MFCGRETDHLQIQVTTGTCCTELAVSHQTQKKQVAPSSSCKKTFVATARKQTKAVGGSETSGFAPSASAISKAKLPTHLLACAQPGTLCLQLDPPHRSSFTFPHVWQCFLPRNHKTPKKPCSQTTSMGCLASACSTAGSTFTASRWVSSFALFQQPLIPPENGTSEPNRDISPRGHNSQQSDADCTPPAGKNHNPRDKDKAFSSLKRESRISQIDSRGQSKTVEKSLLHLHCKRGKEGSCSAVLGARARPRGGQGEPLYWQ